MFRILGFGFACPHPIRSPLSPLRLPPRSHPSAGLGALPHPSPMPLIRQEKTMSLRLPSLLGCAALLLLVSTAQAQTIRPGPSFFIGLRGGATAYGGDIDGTSGESETG